MSGAVFCAPHGDTPNIPHRSRVTIYAAFMSDLDDVIAVTQKSLCDYLVENLLHTAPLYDIPAMRAAFMDWLSEPHNAAMIEESADTYIRRINDGTYDFEADWDSPATGNFMVELADNNHFRLPYTPDWRAANADRFLL